MAGVAIRALAALPKVSHLDLDKARLFWSFQPIKAPVVPSPHKSKFKSYNSVNAFILWLCNESGF